MPGRRSAVSNQCAVLRNRRARPRSHRPVSACRPDEPSAADFRRWRKAAESVLFYELREAKCCPVLEVGADRLHAGWKAVHQSAGWDNGGGEVGAGRDPGPREVVEI